VLPTANAHSTAVTATAIASSREARRVHAELVGAVIQQRREVGRVADAVLQEDVPHRHERHQVAQLHAEVRERPACNRDLDGELGVAEDGEPRDGVRDDDGRPGRVPGLLPREHEDAGPDAAADAEPEIRSHHVRFRFMSAPLRPQTSCSSVQSSDRAVKRSRSRGPVSSSARPYADQLRNDSSGSSEHPRRRTKLSKHARRSPERMRPHSMLNSEEAQTKSTTLSLTR
jgi:hypothetical protein